MSNKWIYFLIACSLLSSCGRKNNNFLSFPDENDKQVKVNKLRLPSIRGISIEKKGGNLVELSWQSAGETDLGKLLGYNIYRFPKTAFIPKHSINPNPISKEFYVDKLPKNITVTSLCYVIRAVFDVQGKIVEGPGGL